MKILSFNNNILKAAEGGSRLTESNITKVVIAVDAHDESIPVVKPPRPWWRRGLKWLGRTLLLVLIAIVIRQAWHHHEVTKKLEETLAELDRTEPGWRLEEIEAAREKIPDEENSARVVVATARLLPKNWPPKEFEDLFDHLEPSAQLAPEDFAQLNRELENVRPALEEARKLAAMPRGRHWLVIQRNPLDTLLPDQQESRRVVKLLVYDALRQDQTQDMKAALTSCRAVLNTARSLGDEPIAISQLVRMSGVMTACRAIERALAQGEAPPNELADLQKLLVNEDVLSDLLIVVRGERAGLHETYEAIESSDAPLTQLDRTSSNWENYVFGWFARDKFREAHPAMLTCMTRVLEIAQLPNARASRGRKTI